MKTLEERFWRKVKKTDNCWLWLGFKNREGYGMFYLGNTTTAHRVSYMIKHGSIPEGLHIDHLCRVRNCVNPDHLEAVTPSVNVKRGGNSIKTHCIHGHPLSGENLKVYEGKRKCRTCKTINSKKYYQRKTSDI